MKTTLRKTRRAKTRKTKTRRITARKTKQRGGSVLDLAPGYNGLVVTKPASDKLDDPDAVPTLGPASSSV